MLGVGAGFWLDKKWGTSPWMILLGVFAGFALGFYIIWRTAQEMGRSYPPVSGGNRKNERS